MFPQISIFSSLVLSVLLSQFFILKFMNFYINFIVKLYNETDKICIRIDKPCHFAKVFKKMDIQ